MRRMTTVSRNMREGVRRKANLNAHHSRFIFNMRPVTA
jgi:hypothetical protein